MHIEIWDAVKHPQGQKTREVTVRARLLKGAAQVTFGGDVPGTGFDQRGLPNAAGPVEDGSAFRIKNIEAQAKWSLVVSKVSIAQIGKYALRALGHVRLPPFFSLLVINFCPRLLAINSAITLGTPS
jgi:hypothetical protein